MGRTLPSAATTRRWSFESAARAGFAAKGVLYALVAVIAVKVAAGEGGRPKDAQGALSSLADEPLGKFLLVALAVGFAAYALWRLAELVLGPRHKHGAEGYGERVADVGRIVVYGGLSAFTWMIVAGVGRTSGSEREQTAMVLDWPGGVALVAALGIVILGVALVQAYRAVTQAFLDELDLADAGETGTRFATWVGTAGHAARTVVFGLVGAFLVKAALEYDAGEAVGLDGALREVAGQPYGRYLLGAVAVGLLLYGAYCLVEARYRRV
jgi:hypothetical protein